MQIPKYSFDTLYNYLKVKDKPFMTYTETVNSEVP